MAFEFKLPDIGEGLVEGEIVKWLVAEGDTVTEDQPIVEVMTDKATVEISSPRNGTILSVLAQEGDVVAVESVFVVIGDAGEAAPAAPATKAAPAAATQEAAASASTSGGNGTATLTERSDDNPLILPPIPSHRVLAAPATRKFARNLGVDLNQITGSGPHGRVTKEDVQRAADGGGTTAAPAAAPAAPAPAGARPVEEVKLIGMRRKISEQMVRSKYTAPHYTYVEEVDMTEIVEFRKRIKNRMDEKGVKITYLPFIIKALIPALKRFPSLNAELDDERGVIKVKHYYNIGIAVSTEQGLMVPVLKDADKKNIWEIAAEIRRLSEAARDRKIRPEDLQDSTFTITSAGNIGGLLATPIINYPEVAIMGVHKIKKRPEFVDDAIAVRDMMYLSLSLDHRVVDGAIAAEFMNEIVTFLENPLLYILGN